MVFCLIMVLLGLNNHVFVAQCHQKESKTYFDKLRPLWSVFGPRVRLDSNSKFLFATGFKINTRVIRPMVNPLVHYDPAVSYIICFDPEHCFYL